MKSYVIYDIETYANLFSLVAKDARNGEVAIFEVSERHNDFEDLGHFLFDLADMKYTMVGFNNLGFDYPVLHELLKLWKRNRKASTETVITLMREKVVDIINTPFDQRFGHIIWPKDQLIPQLDLYKVHHFDNFARATSLKALEFAMRSENVGDLPYDPDLPLTSKQIDEVIDYNEHDVNETFRFFEKSRENLKLRDELSEKFGKDFSNHNDTKIGKDIFVIELERQLGDDICFVWEKGKGRRPRQTKRAEINLGDVLLPYLQFKRPEFRAIHRWFQNQTIKETKGVFSELPFHKVSDIMFYADTTKKKGRLKNVNVVVGGEVKSVKHGRGKKRMRVGGLKFVFGTGGLHACVEPSTWHSDDEWVIIDVDVTSYYPSLAIVNGIYPHHLGPEFCEIYDQLKQERLRHEKGTAENAAYKLALNGVYGDSNNKYSPFFDPQYTMAITINGQLSLCMLSEALMEIPSLKILQVNTDGVTVKMKRKHESKFKDACNWWQDETGLELEEARYSRMFIRDVNNYLSEYEGGKVKRKGAYEWDVQWHQNHSNKVSTKAAEANLLRGTDVEEFIRNHDDPYDFYLLAKCDRSSKLVLRRGFKAEHLQRNNRYFASTDGGELVKIMPPIKKKLSKKLLNDFRRLGAVFEDDELEAIAEALNEKAWFDIDSMREQGYPEEQLTAFELCQPHDRVISVCSSPVTVHNTLKPLKNINYEFYIEEANKLVKAVKKGYLLSEEERDQAYNGEES